MDTKRKIDIAISASLAILFTALIVWSQAIGTQPFSWPSLLEKVAFAGIVALSVRWLSIAFDAVPDSRDVYLSSGYDIRKAIAEARERVWVLQTWLPATDGDAKLILKAAASDKRLLLASFETGSPIYSRARARCDLATTPENCINAAKQNSASSARPFANVGREDVVRFTSAHHSGWVVVADNELFWGFTPLSEDNWTVPEVCHRAGLSNPRAQHWLRHFNVLWNDRNKQTDKPWSHGYAVEQQYNERLR